jgi:TP901 family phage tail tape measure protein
MADRESKFTIGFGGEAADLTAVLNAIKGQFRSTVAQIEQTTKSINLFGDIEKNVAGASKAIADTKKNIDALTASITAAKKAGSPTAELEAQLKSAQQQLRLTSGEFNKQVDALSKLQSQLTKAGIDTGKLATEQARLAAEAKVATAAMVEQASKQALGLKTLRDIQPEVNRLNAAYQSLRDGGKLTFGELSVAQARLQQQTAALRSEALGLGQSFTAVRGQLIAFAAAFAGVTAGILQSTQNFRDFAQQVAAVDSIADSSQKKIDELASGVRELAKNLGVDAVQSTRALYEIISSGIPADNALTVLEAASKAAIAGITDVDTAARVGVAVLNGYGLEITKLDHVYDVLFQTVKDGVITFPELAKNIGTIIPAARAAKVPLEELGAAFVILTRQGFDAPEAAVAINRAIVDLSAPAPQAAERIRDLGIEINGLTGTIEQLAARKFTLAQLTEIVPDVRAQRAVLALVNNFKLLRDELGLMNEAAGQTQAAYLKLADTPQQKLARFNAAVKDLSIAVGQFATEGAAGFVQSVTNIINAFNSLAPATKTSILQFTALATAGAALTVIARTLVIPLNLLAGALFGVGAGGQAAATGITAANVAMGGLKVAVAGFLGFKLGEQLTANFAPFRVLGDLLGTSAASIVNLADFALSKLAAALTGNRKASDEASAAFARNRAVIAEQWTSAITGASERLRELDERQKQLIDNLAKAATAASSAAAALDASVSRIAGGVQAELTGVDQIVARLQGRLTQLQAKLEQNVALVQTIASAAIQTINTTAAQQIAALDNLANSQLQIAAKTLAIQTKQADARLAALKKEGEDSLKAFEAQAAARIEIAKRTGEDLKKVELDVATQRRAVLQTIVDANRAHVAELIQNLTAYQNKVREIELSRVAFNQAADDQIREIRKGSLSEYQKYRSDVGAIDKLISDGRKALAQGDASIAEDFARRAIQAASGVAKAVSDGSGVVVSATTAQSTALRLVAEATKLGNQAFKDQGEAAKDGAEKTKTALDQSITELGRLETKLKEVSEKLSAGIEVSITVNTDAVVKTIAELDAKIREQDHLLLIKADITLAQVEIKRLKDELEVGIVANVHGRTDEIEAALKRVQAEKPEIELDIKKAIGQVNEVRSAAQSIENIHVQIESNAADVKKEILALNGIKTESTHTIKVQRVEANAAGGLVGAMAQRFAGGGPVFSRPGWSKVPGSGNGDTVPAALQRGSFVLRKAASMFYGDGLLDRLKVARFAGGGFAGGGLFQSIGAGINSARTVYDSFYAKANPAIADTPFIGDIQAGTTQSVRDVGQIGPPKLPSDPRELLRKVLEYAAEVVREGRKEPRVFSVAIDQLNSGLREYERRPDEDTLMQVLQLARSIGLNLGVSTGALHGFDIDGRKWHKEPISGVDPFHALGFSPLAASYNFFAKGGQAGGDTIPAMLTPGEHVIAPPRVRELGSGFMDALNNMMVPREILAAMLSPMAPRPPVARFATGGAVGAAVASSSVERSPGGVAAGASLTFNLNASAQDLYSEANVRRYFMPVFDKITNRSK